MLSIEPQTTEIPCPTIRREIRALAWARAIRWIGWGFGESLIPILVLRVSKTFAQMGLFSSTTNIVALASLPIIGTLADRMPAKRLILLSLVLYPLVGISYFLAGAFGIPALIIVAMGFNGFTWELENVGIATYYRRVTESGRIAVSFGYLDTLSYFAWIAAALAGMLLVLAVPIHYLLFAIAPFSLAAYFVALRVPNDSAVNQRANGGEASAQSYKSILTGWRSWNTRLWLVCALILFSGIINALVSFFMPVEAYLSGANLPMVALLSIFGAIPALFGYKFGHVADSQNRFRVIGMGLFGIALIAVSIGFLTHYWFKIVGVFFLGVILELFSVTQSSLITTLGPAATYGKRGSAFEGVITFGDLLAPLLLGVGFDVLGFTKTVILIAGAGAALGASYWAISE